MSVDISKYYDEPLDIVKYLRNGKAAKIMESAIKKAIMFHEKTGLSPIVKVEKYEIYTIDYYFMVKCLSEFIHNDFMLIAKTEADEIKDLVLASFGKNAGHKNKKLLINLFDYCDILYASKDKKWTYTLLLFEGKHNGKKFILSGVKFDGNFLKELDKQTNDSLAIIADSSNYELLKTGPKVYDSGMEEIATGGLVSFR